MRESIYQYIMETKGSKWYKRRYQVIKHKSYFSERYQKRVEIHVTDAPYDGATFARDINSFGWLMHDVLKRNKVFSDGTECTNLQASAVLRDILLSENRWFRANTWYIATLTWGFFVN